MTDGYKDIPLQSSISASGAKDVSVLASIEQRLYKDVSMKASIDVVGSKDISMKSTIYVERVDYGMYGDSEYESAPRHTMFFAQGGTPDKAIAATDPYWFIKSGDTESGTEGFFEIGIGQNTTYTESDANLTAFVRVTADGGAQVKIKPGVVLMPTTSAPSEIEGMLYYNDSTNKLNYWDNISWKALDTGTGAPDPHGAGSHTGAIFAGANDNLGAFYLDIGEISAPSTPSSDVRRLFVDSATNEVSVVTDGGATVSLEGVGGGPGSGTQWDLPVWTTTTTLGDSMVKQDSGGTSLTIEGSATIDTIAAEATDVDKFLVSNAGLVKFRTGAEAYADMDGYVTADFTTDFAAETLNNLSTKSHDDLDDVSVDDHHSETHVLAVTGPHTGTLPLADLAAGTQGSIIYRDATDWAELALGTTNYALVSGATDVAWTQYDYSWLANIPSTFAPTSHGQSAHTGDVIPDANQSFDGFLDIVPTATTGDIVDITSTATTTGQLRALHIDFSGITDSAQVLRGIEVDMPASYSGSSDMAAYFHGGGKSVYFCSELYAMGTADDVLLANVYISGGNLYMGTNAYIAESTNAFTFYTGTTPTLALTLEADQDASFAGAVTIGSIVAGVSDYDKFLVSDTGEIKFRTGAEVASDIGAATVPLALTDLASYVQGSIIRGGGVDWEAYALGTTNYVLKAGATDVAWGQVDYSELVGTQPAPVAHVLATTGPHSGTLPLADLAVGSQGSIIIRGAADWEELTLGTTNYALVSGATDVAWTQYDYTWLASIPSTFAPSTHVLAGTDHTASGLTVGWVIAADSATTFSWQVLPDSPGTGTQYALPRWATTTSLGDSALVENVGGTTLAGTYTSVSFDSGANTTNISFEIEGQEAHLDLNSDPSISANELAAINWQNTGTDLWRLASSFGYNQFILSYEPSSVDVFKMIYNAGVEVNWYIDLFMEADLYFGSSASFPKISNDSNALGLYSGTTPTLALTLATDQSATLVGPLTINNINAGVADYDVFLVSDSGLVKFRTGAEVLSDIGAAASSHDFDTHSGDVDLADLAAGTQGSIIYRDVTDWAELSLGTNTYVLKSGATDVSWSTVDWTELTGTQPAPVAHVLATSGPHSGELPWADMAAGTQGGIIRRGASDWEEYALGTTNYALVAGATDAAWAQYDYTWLANIPSTFAPSNHALAGTDHTAAGLTVGWVIAADSATTFSWQAQAGTLSGTQWTLPVFDTTSSLGDSMVAQDSGGTLLTVSGAVQSVTNLSMTGELDITGTALPLLDLNPTGTAAGNIIDISGPEISTGTITSIFDQNTQVLSTTATYRGIYIDWDGITRDAGTPSIRGVHVALPSSYTGYGVCHAGYFVGGGRSVYLANNTYAIEASGASRFTSTVNIEGLLTADGVNPEGDLADSLGTSSLTWLNLYVQDVRDAAGNIVISNDGAGEIDQIGSHSGISTNDFLKWNGTTWGYDAVATISGTQWTLPVFDTTTSIGDSMVSQDSGGTLLTVSGAVQSITNLSMTGELDMTGTGAVIDLNPSGTGSQTIIDITPSASLVAGSTWIGASVTMGALDPATGTASDIYGFFANGTGVLSADDDANVIGFLFSSPQNEDSFAFRHHITNPNVTGTGQTGFFSRGLTTALTHSTTNRGIWIDWDGVTRTTNAPIVEGIRVEMPTDYTDFGTSFAGTFIGDGKTVEVCNDTYSIDATGEVRLNTINAAVADHDKFLVSDSGVIEFRTGAEAYSDMDGYTDTDTEAVIDAEIVDGQSIDNAIDALITTHNVANNHLDWTASVGTIHTDNYLEYTDAAVESVITAEIVDGQSIDNAIDSLISTHTSDDDAHHAVYLDSDAVAAVVAEDPLSLTNALSIGSIVAGVSDYDKFLVSDAGVVKFRTGAEVASDIGAATVPLALTDLASYAQGSLIIGGGADWEALAKGTNTQVLTSDGTDISWQDSASGGPGTGTQWTIPVWDTTSTLGDSMIAQDSGGATATITGDLTMTNDPAVFTITDTSTARSMTITMATSTTDPVIFQTNNAYSFVVDSTERIGIADSGVITLNASTLLPDELDMTGALACIDLNPAGTGTKTIIDITPTAALAAASTWRGIDMTLDALDPATGAVSTVHGVRVSAEGIDSVDANTTIYGFLFYPSALESSTGFYAGYGAITQAGETHRAFYSYLAAALGVSSTHQGMYLNWGGATRSANTPKLQGIAVTLPADYTNFDSNTYAASLSGDGRTVKICDTTYALDVAGTVRMISDVTINNAAADEARLQFSNPSGSTYIGQTGAVDEMVTGTVAGDYVISCRTGSSIVLSADSSYAQIHMEIDEDGDTRCNVNNYFDIKPATDTYGLIIRDSGSDSFYVNIKNVDGSVYIGDTTSTNASMLRIAATGVYAPGLLDTVGEIHAGSHVEPKSSDDKYLGSTSYEWNRIYVGTGGIYFGTASDVRVYWASSNVLGIADDCRCKDMTPLTNNVSTLGSSSSMKWNSIYVSNVETADIKFANDFVIREVQNPSWNGNPDAPNEDMWAHHKDDGATPGIEFYNNKDEMIALLDEDGDFHIRGKLHECSDIFN